MWIVKFDNLNEFFVYTFVGSIFFQTSGPLLSIPIWGHSMVKLGKKQAILGGSFKSVYQNKIYSITCSNRNCHIFVLNRELSVAKGIFVAVPIPDKMSGCITGGKQTFKKFKSSMQLDNCFPLKFRMPVPNADWGWSLP